MTLKPDASGTVYFKAVNMDRDIRYEIPPVRMFKTARRNPPAPSGNFCRIKEA